MSIHAKILGGVAAAALFAVAPAMAQTSATSAKSAAISTTSKMSNSTAKSATDKATKVDDTTSAKADADAKTNTASAKSETTTKMAAKTSHHRKHRAMSASFHENIAEDKTTEELNAQQLSEPGTTAGVASSSDTKSGLAPHKKSMSKSTSKVH